MTLDEILKINVPLIPNNDVLIDVLKNFVMMRILQRNYRHPVLNLRVIKLLKYEKSLCERL